MRQAFHIPFCLAACAASFGCAATARAEPVQTVIEMFTSQGCASCPTADRYISDLSREAGILALTMPVTYWDYLGWKDNLATPAFTDRQRAYASMRSERSLFTPQAVVNGGEALVGSDRVSVERAVEQSRSGGRAMIAIRAEEKGDLIVVDVGPDPIGRRQAEVWLVPIVRSRPVAIERGENKGRVVIYTNVVRGLHYVGSWTGQTAHFEVPREAAHSNGADSFAVMLQNAAGGRPSAIIGAAKGPGL